MEKRYVGVDLHRNQFTVCVRLENGRTYVREWRLEALPQFVKKLRATDEVAVEATGNTRLFYEAVSQHVARIVVVATNQFRVITQSVKKTDVNDAQLLALYLAKGLLPDVRMKDKQHGQIASRSFSTTNAVEAVNGQLEILRRNSGGYFQSEESLKLKLGLIVSGLEQQRWRDPTRSGSISTALPQLNTMFQARFEAAA